MVMVQAQQLWEPIRFLSENTLETIQGVVTYLAAKPGERVLVLASSGFLTGTLAPEVDGVIDNALRAGVVINALDAKGLYTEDPGHGRIRNELSGEAAAMALAHEAESFGSDLMSLTAGMADFAVGTGGRFFHDRNDLAIGYYSLAAAPDTEYLLGFVPGNEKLNGSFHKLKVEINIPGKFYVQARPGYFATKEPPVVGAANAKESAEERIDTEVRSLKARSDFPMSVTEKSANANNSPHELRVQTHVEIRKLPFKQQNDRHVNTLTFVMALFDSLGNMVVGKEAQMQLALEPDSFARLSKSGVNGVMSLGAPPGTYRLRVVVEEAVRGEISATTQNVQIQ